MSCHVKDFYEKYYLKLSLKILLMLYFVRYGEGIDEVKKCDMNVLMISHSDVGRMIQSIQENLDAKEFYDLSPLSNSELKRII